MANLPQTIFNAQQNRRTTALQNAFPNGLAARKPQNGRAQIDVQAAGDTLTKLGGAEFAAPLIAQFQDMQIGANAGRDVTGGGNPPTTQTAVYGITGTNSKQSQQPGRISMAGDGTQQNPYRPKSQQDFNGIENGAYWAGPTGPARIKGGGTAPQTPTANDSGGGVRPTPVGGVSGSPGPAPSNAPEAAPQGQPSQGLPGGMGAIGIPLAQYPSQMRDMQEKETYLRGQAAQYAARKPQIAAQLEKQAASLTGLSTKDV